MSRIRQTPATVAFEIYSVDVTRAEKAFDALLAAGIKAEAVSLLARGKEVDRRLIIHGEANANPEAGRQTEPRGLSALAQKLSSGPLLLLDGCWATGPVFLVFAEHTGEQGAEALARALLRAGLSLKDVASVESRLKGQGGVWLAADGDPALAELAVKAVQGIALEVRRLASP